VVHKNQEKGHDLEQSMTRGGGRVERSTRGHSYVKTSEHKERKSQALDT